MNSSGLPTGASILAALLDPIARTSSTGRDRALPEIFDPILALHRSNLEQWGREDDARKDDADDAMVAAAKRDIDDLNIARHGFIEAIDHAILNAIHPSEASSLVTESPGMAIDRLSVLVIRLASTEARTASGAADARTYAERLPRVRSQLSFLEDAITTLLDDLSKGNRRFFAHDSLKLYGSEDPGRVG